MIYEELKLNIFLNNLICFVKNEKYFNLGSYLKNNGLKNKILQLIVVDDTIFLK